VVNRNSAIAVVGVDLAEVLSGAMENLLLANGIKVLVVLDRLDTEDRLSLNSAIEKWLGKISLDFKHPQGLQNSCDGNEGGPGFESADQINLGLAVKSPCKGESIGPAETADVSSSHSFYMNRQLQ
jgi:hypothetical protein